jgi:hypothetical protein
MLSFVTITAQTRKLLWGRSGGLCAKCRQHLTEEAAEPDPVVVKGEECHIVSSRPDGPRHRRLDPEQVDAYDNLILLCPSDHKIVDKQPRHYTEESLRAMKRAHEGWVRQLPGLPHVRLRRDLSADPVALQLADSGRDVLANTAGRHAAEVMTPEVADVEEADLVGGFIQAVQDWADIAPELDMPARLRAELDVTDQLKELREAGFVVYCGHRQDTLEGGTDGPSPWRVSIIGVFRMDDPRVRSDTSPSQLTADQEYWREQIIAQSYPLIGQVETYADFEIDSEIRGAVAQYARTMRGAVKGKFHDLAAALPSDHEEERILVSGTRSELIQLLKTYCRLFD